MKQKIIPITALRDTQSIEELAKSFNGPIFVTKNGFGSLVLMSEEVYERDFPFADEVKKPSSKKDVTFNDAQDDPLGYVRVRSAGIETKVGNIRHNVAQVEKAVEKAAEDEVHILVFPELTLTGYTLADLLLDNLSISNVEKALERLRKYSEKFDVFFSVGAPLVKGNSVYNCSIQIQHGNILGVTPKMHLPSYNEFYEKRWFEEGPEENSTIEIAGKTYPFGSKIIYVDRRYQKLKICTEICEDLWVVNSPSSSHVLAGSTVVLNLSASNDIIGKKEYRTNLVKMASAKGICAYVYANCGLGESSTDVVYSGHKIIAENGWIVSETEPFANHDATADIDLEKLINLRRKVNTFRNRVSDSYWYIPFSMEIKAPNAPLRRPHPSPFLPESGAMDLNRVSSIINIQSYGLLQRLRAIHCHKVIVGLSGGLDSTLALLVANTAFENGGLDKKDILCVTLPCFGTSKRTHDNAVILADALGVSFREISISDSVMQHFKDIGHDPNIQNATYENAQARERTQVLMDLANDMGALMIGTGDLSELVLGWTTYGGDHMSMYGVNASIPKTLVQYLCEGYALMHPEVHDVLMDVIHTPISPELLPTSEGEIAQKTESAVGPYELQDFFLYYYLRYTYRPKKILYMAKIAFEGKYGEEEIAKWMKVFFSRFFQSQFKRSCLPDGPKVGTIAISPRGDLRMPSDADCSDYLADIDELVKASRKS